MSIISGLNKIVNTLNDFAPAPALATLEAQV